MQPWNDTLDDAVRRAAWTIFDRVSNFTQEDREDLEQEGRMACVKWMAVNSAPLGPGLARILTINAARDYERMTRRHRDGKELPPGVTTDPWSEDSCLESQVTGPNQEYEAVLGDILGKIVNDEREAAVALHVVYEGLTVREAADALSVGRSTVQDIMDRLRARAEALGVGV